MLVPLVKTKPLFIFHVQTSGISISIKNIAITPFYVSCVFLVPPGKMNKPTTTSDNPKEIMVNWNAPIDTGTSKITEYLLMQQVNSGAWVNIGKVRGTLQKLLTDLNPAEQYSFKVAARSDDGTGPYSDPSDPLHPSE